MHGPRSIFTFRWFFSGLALLAWGWLAGCSGFLPGGQTPVPFIPPTLVQEAAASALAALTPTPTALPEVSRPTATPACTNILSFLEDVTIPDGTITSPGGVLDKRWRVENTGTCNWDEDYRLKLVSGAEMGAAVEQALYPARSGTQFEIRVVFQAPQEAGLYRSAWQAYSPKGDAFGDPFYIEIVVEAP